MSRTRVLVSLVLAVAVVASAPLVVAGGPDQEKTTKTPCAMAADQHKAMEEKSVAMDARLNELVSAMNAAEGDAKVAAMAAVVNELVAQRSELRKLACKDHQAAMHHLMWHMHDGGHGKDCPMAMQHEEMHPEEPEGEDTAATH